MMHIGINTIFKAFRIKAARKQEDLLCHTNSTAAQSFVLPAITG